MSEELVNCPYCEAPNSKESRFCRKCGARLPQISKREAAELLLNASLHLANKRYEEAEEICRKVLEQDPYNADAHSLLGDVLEGERNIPSAIKEYEEASRLSPQEQFFRSRLVELRRKLSRRRTFRSQYLLWLIALPFLLFLVYRLFSLLIAQATP